MSDRYEILWYRLFSWLASSYEELRGENYLADVIKIVMDEMRTLKKEIDNETKKTNESIRAD